MNVFTLKSYSVPVVACAAFVLLSCVCASLGAIEPPTPPTALPLGTSQGVDAVVNNAQLGARVGSASVPAQEKEQEPDPFRRNANGVQTYFPSVAKIVGRSFAKTRDDGVQTVPFYYGTGSYVAEYRDWGIVVTNWHVVSEAEEAIDVVFPGASYSAQVILRDEVWDLAALLVRKPANLVPLPISHEVPQIGDYFWVGGYGQSSGLSDFQMRSGVMTTYVSLVDSDEIDFKELLVEEDGNPVESDENERKTLSAEYAERLPESAFSPLYETISIKQGVRQGDSGGPIFNKYGELSGVLWGSDGKCTMGTPCLRLQVFVTQALKEAAEICARDLLASEAQGMRVDFLSGYFRNPNECAVAQKSQLAMQDAFEAEGIFPVSTRNVYTSADGLSAEDVMRLSQPVADQRVERAAMELNAKNKGAVPPYPPVFSPTFVSLQRNFKSARPELSTPKTFAALDAYALNVAKKERENDAIRRSQELWASVDEISGRRLVAVTAKEDDASLTLAPVSNSSDEPKEEKSAPSELASQTSEPQEQGAPAADQVKDAPSEPTTEPLAETEPQLEEERDKDGESLSDFKTYVVVIGVFFIFCVAMRFMQAGNEAARKKRSKPRLQQKK